MLCTIYCLIIVLVTRSGVVSPTMPVSYITHASVLVPVVSPLSSPLVHHYCLPLPNLCTLGQQVNAYCLPMLLLS